MYILLYMKCILCSGFAELYDVISRTGDGVSLSWVYVHSAIYETAFGVVVIHRSIVD